ncbi:SAM-dependent methyltransferase [Bradyrhizobium sp. LM6.10]
MIYTIIQHIQMDVLDTSSSASRRISSESLRKISFRIFSDLARLGDLRSLVVLNDRENLLSALREKPLKVYEVMKGANIVNEEACQSLLLKMRDEGLVKFGIQKRAMAHRMIREIRRPSSVDHRRLSAALGDTLRLGRSERLRKLGRPVMALARAATLLVAFSATRAPAADIGYLAPPGAAAKEFPSPQRPVARIVSPHRSGEELRDSVNEAGQIARLLELKPGMTVGDIGAGDGYHTVRLSHLVGPAGSVVAQDVTRDYLIELAKRTELLKLTNVKFALGEPHDPRLPASSLDAAILVHMYHEIAQPYAFFYNLIPALKRGARVGIVDLEFPTSSHGTPIELLRCELTAVGYRAIATYELAGRGGYLAVFSPPEQAHSPRDIVPCEDRTGAR